MMRSFFLLFAFLCVLGTQVAAQTALSPSALQTQTQTQNDSDQQQRDRPVANQERTLSMIKPDAVRQNHIGDIISRFEHANLRIAAIKMVWLTPEQASQFYRVHQQRPFYRDLVRFMSSGPVVVMVLEGNEAINKNRQLMGATDPSKAEKGTIRADFAQSVSENAIHGSDSPQTAREEISFFFGPGEVFSR